jgi:hypothetical protein
MLTARETAGVAEAFLQLIGLSQDRRFHLLRWIGSKSYQDSTGKRSARFRKGAILDRKAE